MNDDLKQHPELWLFRHGETEWSKNGKHTSYTDLPLTAHGREQAQALAPVVASVDFDLALASPRQRARDTAALAGLKIEPAVEPNLQEWNYGIFEGKSTPEIRESHPDWNVWTAEIEGGEPLHEVAARAHQVIDRCLAHGGRCALFAHAHILRILSAVWMGDAEGALGERLSLSTGTYSVLGWERDTRVLSRWNVPSRR
jgi:probable phosphoglycerate mutase